MIAFGAGRFTERRGRMDLETLEKTNPNAAQLLRVGFCCGGSSPMPLCSPTWPMKGVPMGSIGQKLHRTQSWRRYVALLILAQLLKIAIYSGNGRSYQFTTREEFDPTVRAY
jgi:hypothetical protein